MKGGPCTAGTWKNWKSSTFGDFAPYLKSRCWIALPTRSVWNQCSSISMNDHVRSTGCYYAAAAEDIIVGQRNSIKNNFHWCKIRPKEYVADRSRWRIIVHEAPITFRKIPLYSKRAVPPYNFGTGYNHLLTVSPLLFQNRGVETSSDQLMICKTKYSSDLKKNHDTSVMVVIVL